MNCKLSDEEIDALLQVLSRGFVLIRAACQVEDGKRAEAIADALHNLPHLLRDRDPAWSAEEFKKLFLDPVVRSYPDLQELSGLWPPKDGRTRGVNVEFVKKSASDLRRQTSGSAIPRLFLKSEA